ncbi:hypothetical protein CV014_16415 [Nostoc sp. CMAA1605]|nr:hypothetical protein [Nostoc sp. CMAA1605]
MRNSFDSHNNGIGDWGLVLSLSKYWGLGTGDWGLVLSLSKYWGLGDKNNFPLFVAVFSAPIIFSI